MSRVTPGWYPDPSQRNAHRYHDGTQWTEHVAATDGARATDPVTRQAEPAHAPAAGQQTWSGGQAAQQQSWSGGQGTGQQSWSGGQGTQQQEWPRSQGTQQAWSGGQEQSWPGQSQTGYGQAGYGVASPYGSAASAADSGFVPSWGLVVAVVGALLLLASVFVLDFVTFSATDVDGTEVSETFSLSDLRSDEFVDTSEAGRAGQYIDFGFVPVLIVVAAGLVVQFLDPDHPARRGATLATVVVLAWHLSAMFLWDNEPGVSVSPAVGAWVGVVGYLGLAASPWIRQRLLPQNR